MAAMQSLLASMSAEQRAELQSLMDALLRDDRLRWDLAQLAATLDRLLPGGLGQRFTFRGDEPLGLEGALEQLGRLQRMDRLAEALDGGRDDPGDLAAIDPEEVRDLLGRGRGARTCRRSRTLPSRSRTAGYAERQGDRLELTPARQPAHRAGRPRRAVRAPAPRCVRAASPCGGAAGRRAR